MQTVNPRHASFVHPGDDASGVHAYMPIAECPGQLMESGRSYLLHGDSLAVNRILHSTVFKSLCVSDGTVLWVDGGNAFNPYDIAELAERCGYDTQKFLSRIRVARAFTAHQLNSISRSAMAEADLHGVSFLAVSSIAELFTGEVRWREGTDLLVNSLNRFGELTARHGCWTLMTTSVDVCGSSEMEHALSTGFDRTLYVQYCSGRIAVSADGEAPAITRWNAHHHQRSLQEFGEEVC
ncbi:MAG: hypothetical protein KIS30_01105 [Thermoplasmata archaeon]|nr:hypothetical protein [Candidatus Sysuiplasma acidicola]MBX8636992.1 hypothetical protein [Candidatus Sysuiplasma acidicola]MBX8645346.1 hypothetical protein [Candidatus Sysuiplasma acidicola]MDH2906098.1 hypothetical protein [Methanomassiliicoccales archaeon]